MRFCIRGVSPKKNEFNLNLNFLDPTSKSNYPKTQKSHSQRLQIECLRTQIECLRTQTSAAGTINTCQKNVILEHKLKSDSRKQVWKKVHPVFKYQISPVSNSDYEILRNQHRISNLNILGNEKLRRHLYWTLRSGLHWHKMGYKLTNGLGVQTLLYLFIECSRTQIKCLHAQI